MDHKSKRKHQAIKSLENRGESLGDSGFGNDLLETTPKAQCMQKKLISWTALKISSAKGIVKRIKGQATDGDKNFTKIYMIEERYPK